jgi:drug/metabolite transporter (DMT)-like permease
MTLWLALLVVTTLVWGNDFIAISHIVEHVTSMELVVVRLVPVGQIFAALLLPTHGHQVWQMIHAEVWWLVLLGL